MLAPETRLDALREELARRNLDGFVLPLTDEHLSEHVGDYAQRLRWLTGFRGSAGSAVVLRTQAAIFVDGRYTLQVQQQVDKGQWTYQSIPQTSTTAWLTEHAMQGTRIGYDPWLHTTTWVTATRAALKDRCADLLAVDTNPVDAVWRDQPPPSSAKVVVHPDDIAGQSSARKRRDIAAWLTTNKADAVVISALDSVAWTFNVRGQDTFHTPVALAFALVYADGTADLFVAPEKMTNAVVEHLGNSVRRHSREEFLQRLRSLTGKRIAVDPERSAVAIFDALVSAGAQVLDMRDPAVLPKAVKNDAEIAGHKAAQSRDGAALSRFLCWLSLEGTKGTLSELSTAARLREFREATGLLRDLSFETISGFGSNGAIIHYRPDDETNRPLVAGSLYLVDSGGQYIDGTTDVTRTVAIGVPSAQMRDRFTRVLKGHIALARAVFPAGTCGAQLDILARQYLWDVGLDYSHGTGHGVGAYLCGHEGPQRIANPQISPKGTHEPLVPGMILSNEPGYYKNGEFGIRIENLLLVIKHDIADAEFQMLAFETLTVAPIDRELIDVDMLTKDELRWINDYHSHVATIIGPQLEGESYGWLMEVTRPLN